MKYICAIDIGSSKIAACLGCFKKGEFVNLWRDSIAVAGVKQGRVHDVSALTDCLGKLLKKLHVKSGIKIKSAYLGIISQNIIAKHSQAVIALAERGNKSVTRADIQRVDRQARILGSCLEEEIIHSVPLSYSVDNESEVVNPLGLYGHQLKVDLYLACAKISYINTIIEIANRLNLKVNDITLSGLAISQAVFDSKETQGLDILCDIGKDITQALIFKDGKLVYYQTLTLGGDDLTARLSQELSLPYSLSEEIKISYGRIQNSGEFPDREIIVKKGNNYLTLNQNVIIELLSKTSQHVAESIRDIIRPQILLFSLPFFSDKTTLYASGRTACLDGFLEVLEVVIGVPVKVAKISKSALLMPHMRQHLLSGEPILNYLACFGLMTRAINLPNKQSVSSRYLRNPIFSIFNRIKEIYQEYF
ncbi:MAG: cell division FtsA domain-containing protein [Candidatus Omnitrophota bacterium]